MSTSDRLRKLTKEATPGPWVVEDDGVRRAQWEESDPAPFVVERVEHVKRTDATLIALTPELAKWVADVAFLFELGLPMRKGVGDKLLAQLSVMVSDATAHD